MGSVCYPPAFKVYWRLKTAQSCECVCAECSIPSVPMIGCRSTTIPFSKIPGKFCLSGKFLKEHIQIFGCWEPYILVLGIRNIHETHRIWLFFVMESASSPALAQCCIIRSSISTQKKERSQLDRSQLPSWGKIHALFYI